MIRTDPDGPVITITLDRPEKKNALTPDMLEALIAAIADAGGPRSAHAILLAGAGDAFCSGFDLSLCKDDSSALALLLDGLARAIRVMRAQPCPVVIACHGAAIAGGCAFLGGADVVITHPTCRLGYPVVRLGISPAVSAPFFTGAVGHGRAREHMLGGQLFSGQHAHAQGLAHILVPSAEDVLPEARRIAADLAAKPAAGLAATKRWLNELDPAPLADAALQTSLALVGSPEERCRLTQLWS